MKRYRIVYWFGSMTTEHYIAAPSKEEAVEMFKKAKGERVIVNVEECQIGPVADGTKAVRLCRSFKTRKEAEAFAANKFGDEIHRPVNKYNADIYKARGGYKVAWTEVIR